MTSDIVHFSSLTRLEILVFYFGNFLAAPELTSRIRKIWVNFKQNFYGWLSKFLSFTCESLWNFLFVLTPPRASIFSSTIRLNLKNVYENIKIRHYLNFSVIARFVRLPFYMNLYCCEWEKRRRLATWDWFLSTYESWASTIIELVSVVNLKM